MKVKFAILLGIQTALLIGMFAYATIQKIEAQKERTLREDQQLAAERLREQSGKEIEMLKEKLKNCPQ
ncbi:MAG TPA: hypothetical protein PKL56_05925 [Cyclobacteriaceae bacterium]|nr:hypothetical protein [Cyclobacteriaceae bacterium]HMV08407.1 hypothetical protein [Cyclobacteriaceae bacterium]HMX01180.1 hypothetical protein [Cyclobacteriaceae bacterium]HMX50583.1 hypothetical protein [Cyclobacteriaceae bacterium]HMY91982.1 hypothetical protein [Cyclobacteriaceae bacterium]